MKEYDVAARNFYVRKDFKSLPLGSWDLFSLKFNTLCKGLDEINNLKNMAISEKWLDYAFLEQEILKHNHIVVVTDPELNIVHASEGIYDMNGYRPNEIIGKKPKMFQGERTCKKTALEIKNAIKNEQSFETTIINYRKDGSIYNCWIKGTPLRNTSGKVVNFIAFEREVA